MTRFLIATMLLLASFFSHAQPSYVATFHSIGLYWSPPGGDAAQAARVEFRKRGDPAWRRGLDLWFDERDGEYRGSLVELDPGTQYEVVLELESGHRQSLRAKTWPEEKKIKRTVEIPANSKRLVIEPADSGSEREGYVVFTAPPGRNVIDQAGVAGNGPYESCVVVKQGVHHVVIRGLELRGCKRYGIFIERQFEPVLDSHTHDVVIEDNDISGWGGTGNLRPALVDNDGAVHCNYYRETDDAKRPDRIVIQRNTMRDPRHGSNPWRSGAGERKHPMGPQGEVFDHATAERFAALPGLVLVAGRYEGFDERLIVDKVDEELSLGDFVLSGGEIAAMAVIDAHKRIDAYRTTVTGKEGKKVRRDTSAAATMSSVHFPDSTRCAASATSACASRSTISAPATRASPTCAACRSTS